MLVTLVTLTGIDVIFEHLIRTGSSSKFLRFIAFGILR